ncbi:hypothetical protein [Falsiroseomonas sp.]|uniref:hypothetical protein n=1 Tax=Falsiroseomonas sp. TaxID=2870721 RepID=UPI003F7239A0
MANHAGKMTSEPQKLDEAMLDSVIGGFVSAPNTITTGGVGIPLPDIEVPPEILQMPDTPPIGIEAPGITIPSYYQSDVPPDVLD